MTQQPDPRPEPTKPGALPGTGPDVKMLYTLGVQLMILGVLVICALCVFAGMAGGSGG